MPLSTILAVLLILSSDSVALAVDDDDSKIAFNNYCRTCHSFKSSDNRLGLLMACIFGGKAGQVRGYRGYSGDLDGITWNEATLDKLIANPMSVSTSTNMIFPPVADVTEPAGRTPRLWKASIDMSQQWQA